jgi:hypothetical protein
MFSEWLAELFLTLAGVGHVLVATAVKGVLHHLLIIHMLANTTPQIEANKSKQYWAPLDPPFLSPPW